MGGKRGGEPQGQLSLGTPVESRPNLNTQGCPPGRKVVPFNTCDTGGRLARLSSQAKIPCPLAPIPRPTSTESRIVTSLPWLPLPPVKTLAPL